MQNKQPVLVITPGLAFDKSGARIGRGKGYYDRFFKSLKDNEQQYIAMAVCFSCQYFDEWNKIPVTEHDILMDKIISPQ